MEDGARATPPGAVGARSIDLREGRLATGYVSTWVSTGWRSTGDCRDGPEQNGCFRAQLRSSSRLIEQLA